MASRASLVTLSSGTKIEITEVAPPDSGKEAGTAGMWDALMQAAVKAKKKAAARFTKASTEIVIAQDGCIRVPTRRSE